MENAQITTLLADLKNPDEDVRAEATQTLWQIWFGQKGVIGLQTLQRSQRLLEEGRAKDAEDALTELIAAMPDFAEAWNRRAVLRFVQQDFEPAIEDCLKAIDLVPYHFGALHGLGLCYASIGEFRQAIQAFRRALEIQPHAIENQKLILECTAKL